MYLHDDLFSGNLHLSARTSSSSSLCGKVWYDLPSSSSAAWTEKGSCISTVRWICSISDYRLPLHLPAYISILRSRLIMGSTGAPAGNYKALGTGTLLEVFHCMQMSLSLSLCSRAVPLVPHVYATEPISTCRRWDKRKQTNQHCQDWSSSIPTST